MLPGPDPTPQVVECPTISENTGSEKLQLIDEELLRHLLEGLGHISLKRVHGKSYEEDSGAGIHVLKKEDAYRRGLGLCWGWGEKL